MNALLGALAQIFRLPKAKPVDVQREEKTNVWADLTLEEMFADMQKFKSTTMAEAVRSGNSKEIERLRKIYFEMLDTYKAKRAAEESF